VGLLVKLIIGTHDGIIQLQYINFSFTLKKEMHKYLFLKVSCAEYKAAIISSSVDETSLDRTWSGTTTSSVSF